MRSLKPTADPTEQRSVLLFRSTLPSGERVFQLSVCSLGTLSCRTRDAVLSDDRWARIESSMPSLEVRADARAGAIGEGWRASATSVRPGFPGGICREFRSVADGRKTSPTVLCRRDLGRDPQTRSSEDCWAMQSRRARSSAGSDAAAEEAVEAADRRPSTGRFTNAARSGPVLQRHRAMARRRNPHDKLAITYRGGVLLRAIIIV